MARLESNAGHGSGIRERHVVSAFDERPTRCVHSLCPLVRGPVGLRHIDDDDPRLLASLDITVGLRDRLEGILPIDDRAKFARLHARFQQLDNRLGLAALRQWEDDPVTPSDRRPEHEQGVLALGPEIGRCEDPARLQ
jgi:hypothetical protein